MKIILIQCPCWTVQSPPYSLALLSAVLKEKNHSVHCLDINIRTYWHCRENLFTKKNIINENSWVNNYKHDIWCQQKNIQDFINENIVYFNETVELILHLNIPVIGFSVTAASLFYSIETARAIKEKAPEKLILFGGPECFDNAHGTDLLMSYDFINYIFTGEAEKSLPLLLDNIQNGSSDIPMGIAYKDNYGDIINNDNFINNVNLNELPFADFTHFDLSLYTEKLLPINTSRGCINMCSFCNESPFWKKYRMRNPENIVKEISFQKEKYQSINYFWFNDSLINGDLINLEKLCNLLINKNIEIMWGGQAMIRKEMDNNLIKLMKQAGCFRISFGLESGSNKILSLMKKTHTVEIAKEVLKNIHNNNIEFAVNIIVGHPGETSKDFTDTIDIVTFCKQFTTGIYPNICYVSKASDLHKRPERYGIINEFSNKWHTVKPPNTLALRQLRLDSIKNIINNNYSHLPLLLCIKLYFKHIMFFIINIIHSLLSWLIQRPIYFYKYVNKIN